MRQRWRPKVRNGSRTQKQICVWFHISQGRSALPAMLDDLLATEHLILRCLRQLDDPSEAQKLELASHQNRSVNCCQSDEGGRESLSPFSTSVISDCKSTSSLGLNWLTSADAQRG